jgi:hypothetical protein
MVAAYYIHGGSCFVGTQSTVFVGERSYVYFHCYLLFMVDYGLSSLDWLAGFGDGGKMWECGL